MIAEKAGVGVGSLYRYFKNKEDLIHSLFNELLCAMYPQLQPVEPDAPLREQILQLFIRTFSFLYENPKIFIFLEQYFNSPYGIERRRYLLFGMTDQEVASSLPLMFQKGRAQQILKDFPLPMLLSLAFGPVLYLLRDVYNGLIAYEDIDLLKFSEAVWDGIKR
jgi:AcrR family transcriptional regulator